MESLLAASRLSPGCTPPDTQAALLGAVCTDSYDELRLQVYAKDRLAAWRRAANPADVTTLHRCLEAAFLRHPAVGHDLDRTLLYRVCIRCHLTNGLQRWAHVLLMHWLPVDAVLQDAMPFASRASLDALRAAAHDIPERDRARARAVVAGLAHRTRHPPN